MKSINVNELQSKISKVIKDVEKGEKYEIVRYSKSVAFIVSKDSLEEMTQELAKLRSSCRHCVDEFKKIRNKNKKK